MPDVFRARSLESCKMFDFELVQSDAGELGVKVTHGTGSVTYPFSMFREHVAPKFEKVFEFCADPPPGGGLRRFPWTIPVVVTASDTFKVEALRAAIEKAVAFVPGVIAVGAPSRIGD